MDWTIRLPLKNNHSETPIRSRTDLSECQVLGKFITGHVFVIQNKRKPGSKQL